MSIGKANCCVCESSIIYDKEASVQICYLCGAAETAHCVCEKGHYVCDRCHRQKGVDYILDRCREASDKNPIELACSIMRDSSIYPNGPEHHTLVGAVLLTCYKNAGAKIDLESSLLELKQRSLQVPGGTCGYWGTCGAAISAGQFYSIISGATPLTDNAWAKAACLVSRITAALADVGGPRCCKRTSFIAIEQTVRYVFEVDSIPMELPKHTMCSFMSKNSQCKKLDCPYFPNEMNAAS